MNAITSLSDLHLRILAFERRWWRHAGAKHQAILNTFGLHAVTYYRHLNDVLQLPAAAAHDGQTVNRLRRLQRQGLSARRRLL